MVIFFILLAALVIFIIFLLADMAKTGNINTFFDKWVGKTLWLWLPFYALRRLIREIFFDKR